MSYEIKITDQNNTETYRGLKAMKVRIIDKLNEFETLRSSIYATSAADEQAELDALKAILIADARTALGI